MNQQRLNFPQAVKKSTPKSFPSVAASHDENNLRAAREILAEPDAYGGEGSGMVNWARAVVRRLEANNTSGECSQGRNG